MGFALCQNYIESKCRLSIGTVILYSSYLFQLARKKIKMSIFLLFLFVHMLEEKHGEGRGSETPPPPPP
jgi:hypothetical protein